jgi:hypothetical protein
MRVKKEFWIMLLLLSSTTRYNRAGAGENWFQITFNEFLKELEKSKVKLTLSQKAEWEDYFLQESKKALAIKHQIDTTDKNIDQMVYGLYGLSEEEIKIVEGN